MRTTLKAGSLYLMNIFIGISDFKLYYRSPPSEAVTPHTRPCLHNDTIMTRKNGIRGNLNTVIQELAVDQMCREIM